MRIIDNTKDVLAEVDNLATEKLSEVASLVKNTAKDIVVVVTGKLQRSITSKVEDKKAIIGSPLVYAPKIEMNKPFLRPAVIQNKENIRRIFKAK